MMSRGFRAWRKKGVRVDAHSPDVSAGNPAFPNYHKENMPHKNMKIKYSPLSQC